MNQVENIEGSEVFGGGCNLESDLSVYGASVAAEVKMVHVGKKWMADNIWTEAVV